MRGYVSLPLVLHLKSIFYYRATLIVTSEKGSATLSIFYHRATLVVASKKGSATL